jgi:Arc/MetJ family transcription regulator
MQGGGSEARLPKLVSARANPVHGGILIGIIWCYICAVNGGWTMRTTLALDDELVAKAQAFTGLKEKSSLVREALKALIERESARRLARLGGSEPELESPPRRRPARA